MSPVFRPSAQNAFSRQLRLLPVLLHHHSTANHHFSGLARRQRTARVIANGDFHVGRGTACRPGLVGIAMILSERRPGGFRQTHSGGKYAYCGRSSVSQRRVSGRMGALPISM